MFFIKFSVPFDTDQVERTRPSHIVIEVFVRQKNLKRATGHLSPPTRNIRGPTEIPVVKMEKMYPCSFNA